MSFRGDVGAWATPLENMLDMNPQVVARCVDNRDPSAPIFAGDLGTQRLVGLLGFAGLRATSMGLMRLQVGLDPTFAVNTFDTGTVSTWPVDATAGEYDAWGRWTLSGVYQEDEYLALGMPRVFLPTSRVWMQYFRVQFIDPCARDPLSIGVFTAADIWEPAVNFKYDWDYTPVDESDITRVPRGSSFVDERGIRRKLNIGFDQLDEDTGEPWARAFGTMLRTGRSVPMWVIPFSDTGQITRWEKAAVYGLISVDSVLSNPFVGRYAMPVTIDQLY